MKVYGKLEMVPAVRVYHKGPEYMWTVFIDVNGHVNKLWFHHRKEASEILVRSGRPFVLELSKEISSGGRKYKSGCDSGVYKLVREIKFPKYVVGDVDAGGRVVWYRGGRVYRVWELESVNYEHGVLYIDIDIADINWLYKRDGIWISDISGEAEVSAELMKYRKFRAYGHTMVGDMEIAWVPARWVSPAYFGIFVIVKSDESIAIDDEELKPGIYLVNMWRGLD